MNKFKKILKNGSFILLLFIAAAGCDKTDRPELGDYPKDANPPGGPLKFYAAFDGITSNSLMNAVDSVRANFPSDNPLVSVDGVNRKGIKGDGIKAIKYPSANDFNKATSCTISLWVNNTVNPNTELYFSLASKDYWHESAAFLLVENAAIDKCTLSLLYKIIGLSTPVNLLQNHYLMGSGIILHLRTMKLHLP